MSVTISDEVLQSARMTPAELKQEVAVLLFAKEKLSLERAANLAEMHQADFQHLLASRRIPLHYDVEEFEQDLAILRKRGRI
jgi:predicted HTH domain antitoxin